jgi:competence protein ComEC
MVFGGAERLGERLGDAFRLSGLSHLVVLSGYNVALVASWIGAALSLFGFRARVYGGVLGIIGFVLLAGAGAPAIRAGIMASLALLAQVAGRQTQAIRLILIAGAGMTLVSPASVAFDLSFQLSFLAALGIAVFSPVFGERLPHAFPKFFRDALAATLATQVVVLPLLLFRIGLLSPYALLANLLAVPLVPIAMIASMTTGFVALLLPELAVLPGIVAYGALIAILLIAEYVPRLPYAGVTVPVFSLSIVLVCYGFLTLAAWHFTELSKSAARQRIRYPHGVPLSAPRR